MVPILISLNGWPGVGKLSAGMALADRIDGRLLDNHSWMNVAIALTQPGSATNYEAARTIREIEFSYALVLPAEVPIILTNVNATGGKTDFAEEHWQATRTLASRRNVPLVSITLTCDPEEQARRIAAPERRLNRKMRDRGIVSQVMASRTLFDHDADYRYAISTTHASPEDCASEITDWIETNVPVR